MKSRRFLAGMAAALAALIVGAWVLLNHASDRPPSYPAKSPSKSQSARDRLPPPASPDRQAKPIRSAAEKRTRRLHLWDYRKEVRDEIQIAFDDMMRQFDRIVFRTDDKGGILFRDDQEGIDEYERLLGQLYEAAYSDPEHFAAFFDMMSEKDVSEKTVLGHILSGMDEEGRRPPYWTDLGQVRRVIEAYGQTDREQDRYLLATVFRCFGTALEERDVLAVIDLLRKENESLRVLAQSAGFLYDQYDRFPAVKQYLIESFLAENAVWGPNFRRADAFAFFNVLSAQKVFSDPAIVDMLISALRSKDPEVSLNAVKVIPVGGGGSSPYAEKWLSFYAEGFTSGATDEVRAWSAVKLAHFESPEVARRVPAWVRDPSIPEGFRILLLESIGGVGPFPGAGINEQTRDEMFKALTAVTQDFALAEAVRWQGYVTLVKHTATYAESAGMYGTGQSVLDHIRRAMKDPSPAIQRAAKKWYEETEATGKASFSPDFPVNP